MNGNGQSSGEMEREEGSKARWLKKCKKEKKEGKKRSKYGRK